MAALLLFGAGTLHVRSDAAGPAGHGDWCWCDACHVWVPSIWEAHEAGDRHQESLHLIQVKLA